MDTIQAGDLRNGVTFSLDGKVMMVVEFLHVKPGKGAAFVRTKLKDVITGGVLEKTFNPTDKFDLARIERKDMSYCYEDGDIIYFMDAETYDQVPINKELCEDALQYVTEEMTCVISFYQGKAFSVEPPNFVELEITFCEPGVKGNTAQGATKPATLQTGKIVQVPLFVNEGDKIRIDTRTGQYMSRV